jgi:hypothetical protein
MTEKMKMADRLFQNINEFHASLKDDQTKSQFRADYTTLVETKFPLPPAYFTVATVRSIVFYAFGVVLMGLATAELADLPLARGHPRTDRVTGWVT